MEDATVPCFSHFHAELFINNYLLWFFPIHDEILATIRWFRYTLNIYNNSNPGVWGSKKIVMD